ncbi:hypothetical protein BKA93DRAFT_736848, partial [Sparassis latifolia]
PPITLNMLLALKAILDLFNSFDACVWAAASCAFWGMMRFSEVSSTLMQCLSGRHAPQMT